jgi:glutamate 5-kinase
MPGFIVVDAETGRRLRQGSASVTAAEVLDASGAFRAGERVHVVVRGRDGGQGVLAIGVVRSDGAALERAGGRDGLAAVPAIPGEALVMHAQDVALLWPRGS